MFRPGRRDLGERMQRMGYKMTQWCSRQKKEDNGRRCNYCIGKGWKGLNNTESECYTKKRKKSKAKAAKAQDPKEESESEGVTIKAVRIGKL